MNAGTARADRSGRLADDLQRFGRAMEGDADARAAPGCEMASAVTIGRAVPRGPSGDREGRSPGLAGCFLWVGATWAALLAADRLLALPGAGELARSAPGQAAGILAVAALATAVWVKRRALYLTVTSIEFSVALMTALLAATVAGTLILQHAGAADMHRIYGAALGDFLLRAGLDDLFHSLWFGGLLVLLCGSLVLTVVRNRAWQMAMWGALLSHLGVVVIVAGGFIGHFLGMKGFIGLHEGEVATAVAETDHGAPTGRRVPLGFGLRLDDFEMEAYAPEHRIRLYVRDGDSARLARSFDLDKAKDWTPIGRGDLAFRVTGVYPDFELADELRPASSGAPALELRPGGDGARPVNLFAGDPSRDRVDLGPEGPLVRFVWEAPGDGAALGETGRPEAHRLSVASASGALEERLVLPGREYGFDGGALRVRVLQYLPDFLYDGETREARSRSAAPNNPALQVAIGSDGVPGEETRWLFARMPDFGSSRDGAGPRLAYRHEPARAAPDRELLIVGETGEAWRVEGGRVVERTAVGRSGAALPGLAASFRVLPSAVEARTPRTRSEAWRNPVVDLAYRSAGQERPARLAASHARPLRLPDGSILAFEGDDEEPKAFRSRLAVIADGEVAATRAIEVNHPLTYGGYAFYQSDYRKEDPSYSGILVVRDPGLPVVLAGLAMICAGLLYAFYARPRLHPHRARP